MEKNVSDIKSLLTKERKDFARIVIKRKNKRSTVQFDTVELDRKKSVAFSEQLLYGGVAWSWIINSRL